MTKRKKSTPTFGEQIAQQILENYDLKNAQDIQDALKQVFGPILSFIDSYTFLCGQNAVSARSLSM